MTLLRDKRYGYLTQDDEDAARRRINRELHPARPRRPVKSTVSAPRGQESEPSKDERLAGAIARVAAQKRVPPLTIVREMKLDWTVERYHALLQATEDARLRRLGRGEEILDGRRA